MIAILNKLSARRMIAVFLCGVIFVNGLMALNQTVLGVPGDTQTVVEEELDDASDDGALASSAPAVRFHVAVAALWPGQNPQSGLTRIWGLRPYPTGPPHT